MANLKVEAANAQVAEAAENRKKVKNAEFLRRATFLGVVIAGYHFGMSIWSAYKNFTQTKESVHTFFGEHLITIEEWSPIETWLAFEISLWLTVSIKSLSFLYLAYILWKHTKV